MVKSGKPEIGGEKAMKGNWIKGLLAVVGSAALAVSAMASTGSTAHDSEIRSAAASVLQSRPELRGVQPAVEDGIVTLRGSVATYPDKAAAGEKTRKIAHVTGVRNLVQVEAPGIDDAALQAKLAKSLAYDRAHWGNVFNVLTVGVKDGVVTVGGEVRTPVDKDSALGLVAHTKGVKDVVDNVKVAPLSGYDDRLRLRLVRAIYGDSALSRYGMDPQAPIRILVDNGKVGLYGAVDSKMDRDIAFIRANGAFGAFSVENNLQVGGDASR
jgi:hyperosmotically inducible periplasmic protein